MCNAELVSPRVGRRGLSVLHPQPLAVIRGQWLAFVTRRWTPQIRQQWIIAAVMLCATDAGGNFSWLRRQRNGLVGCGRGAWIYCVHVHVSKSVRDRLYCLIMRRLQFLRPNCCSVYISSEQRVQFSCTANNLLFEKCLLLTILLLFCMINIYYYYYLYYEFIARISFIVNLYSLSITWLVLVS